MNKIILILLLMISASFSKTFFYTTQPDHNINEQKSKFLKLSQYLEKELNVKVQFIPTTSYGNSISAFSQNKVQLAWFGAIAGIKARRLVSGSTAIIQGFEDTKFYSYFIANTNAGIKASKSFPRSIKGKSFLFGSKESTSGRLMPEYYIRWIMRNPPEKVFSKVGFSGSHSKTIAMVENGTYQVGVVNYAVWDKELKDGIINTSRVKVIWKSLKYPDYQFSIRGDVDKEFGKGFTKKVQNAFLKIKDKEILATFHRSKFIKATNSEYEIIEGVAQTVGLIK